MAECCHETNYNVRADHFITNIDFYKQHLGE